MPGCAFRSIPPSRRCSCHVGVVGEQRSATAFRDQTVSSSTCIRHSLVHDKKKTKKQPRRGVAGFWWLLPVWWDERGSPLPSAMTSGGTGVIVVRRWAGAMAGAASDSDALARDTRRAAPTPRHSPKPKPRCCGRCVPTANGAPVHICKDFSPRARARTTPAPTRDAATDDGAANADIEVATYGTPAKAPNALRRTKPSCRECVLRICRVR